jgi:hypothetical protein
MGAAFAARPGEAEDPLVSLSFLKSGVAFTSVTLADGEKLKVTPGEELILLDGDVRLECMGKFAVCDISKAKIYNDPKKLEQCRLLIFMGNSTVTVIAAGKADCLVRGLTLE